MKVPTYEAKLQRPRQGQGQFLTAQLSASAMAAPARAFAQSGQQLAEAGSDLAAFGMKKAQIGAQSEAASAASKMQLELAELESNALQNTNMSQAEQQYRQQSQIIVEKYKTSMSNALARRAFGSAAVKAQTRGLLSFVKQNNARVVEAAKANLETTIQQEMKLSSDPSQSSISRRESFLRALMEIRDNEQDIGPDEVRIQTEKLYSETTQNTLLNLANRQGADAAAIATAFRNGNSADPMVQALRENLSAIEIDKIATTLEKTAARNAKRDNDARQANDAAAKQNDEGIVRQILFGNPDQQNNDDLFDGIKDSTHIPVGTLRTVETYLAGGAQVDNQQHVLEVSRLISNDEITNDVQLIKKIGDDNLEITANTLRTQLLPLITTKTDRAFSQAIKWAEASLGYDASSQRAGIPLFEDKANKALKMREEMLAWQYSKNKTIKDPMLKAKEIAERLLAQGNQSAAATLPTLKLNYENALKSGDQTRIANARLVFNAALVEATPLTTIQSLKAGFDPLKYLEELPQ